MLATALSTPLLIAIAGAEITALCCLVGLVLIPCIVFWAWWTLPDRCAFHGFGDDLHRHDCGHDTRYRDAYAKHPAQVQCSFMWRYVCELPAALDLCHPLGIDSRCFQHWQAHCLANDLSAMHSQCLNDVFQAVTRFKKDQDRRTLGDLTPKQIAYYIDEPEHVVTRHCYTY